MPSKTKEPKREEKRKKKKKSSPKAKKEDRKKQPKKKKTRVRRGVVRGKTTSGSLTKAEAAMMDDIGRLACFYMMEKFPRIVVSPNAKATISSLVVKMLEAIFERTFELSRIGSKKVISTSDVHAAMRTTLPDELARESVVKGAEGLARLHNNTDYLVEVLALIREQEKKRKGVVVEKAVVPSALVRE